MLSRALQVAAGNSQESADIAEAIDFDGTNDYLSRSSDLTGNTDSKTFTFSAWVWLTNKGGNQYLYDRGSRIVIYVTTAGNLAILGYNSAGLLRLNASVSEFVPWNTFANILISVDLANTANRGVYINDVAQTVTWSNYTNDTLNFAGINHYLLSSSSVTSLEKGRASNVFLDYTYRNLSIEANRRLFVTADLKPAAGQAALSPILYLPMNDPTAPGVNAGTGGNFTLTGTVARSGRGPNQENLPAVSLLSSGPDFLSKTSMSNAVIGGQRKFTCSVTYQVTASGQFPFLLEGIRNSGANRNIHFIVTSTGFSIRFYGDGGTVCVATLSSSSYGIIGRYYTVTCSGDAAVSGSFKCYVNGVDVTALMTGTTLSNFAIRYDDTSNFWINANGSGNQRNCTISSIWVSETQVDLSAGDPFWSEGPFSLLTMLQTIGVTPLICLPMYGNNAGKNYGTGGDFTVNSGPYTGARGPNEYWGNKADFNGTTGYLSHSSALSGVSNGKTFSVSFNVNTDVIPPSASYVFAMADGASRRGVVIQFLSNTLRFLAHDSVGTEILSAQITSPTISAGTNYYVQACFDLSNTSKRFVYINGSVATVTWSTYTNSTISNTAIEQRIGAAAEGSAYNHLNGKLSEFYFTTEYIDFSQEANRLKFRDAFGNPVNLTQQIEDAAIPNPAIYMRFPPTAFGTNSGTGGAFTVNGTITDGGQL